MNESVRTALDADPKSLDRHERNFVAQIREHGWFDTHVIEDSEGPGFNYTTGFWRTIGFPELISFSLADPVLHQIFWNLFRGVKEGETFRTGERIADVLENFDVMLLPVDRRHYRDFVGWSRWFYGGDDFPTLQLVWPDRENRFPWEAGAAPEFVLAQPDLTSGKWGGLGRER